MTIKLDVERLAAWCAPSLPACPQGVGDIRDEAGTGAAPVVPVPAETPAVGCLTALSPPTAG